MKGPIRSRLAVALVALPALLAASGGLRAEPPDARDPGAPSWRKLETRGESGLTFESACAWDPRAGRLVMFGGHGLKYAGNERHDTWLFDPETASWSHADPANRPPGACNTREIVFDESTGRSAYFGGCMYFHEWQWKAPRIRGGAPPWVYDAVADTWIPMKPTGDTPKRVAYAGMAYDTDNQVLVKFGGGGCKSPDDGGTWIYDGYANTWSRMDPPESPESGRLPAMVYDEKHRVVLLYGAGDGTSSDLWAYDIRRDSWARLPSRGGPEAGLMINQNWGGPVDYSTFVYDRGLGKPILFRPAEGVMGAWSYDRENGTWTRLAAGEAPPGAGLAQAAHLPERRTTLFVNGGTPGYEDLMRGTWAFSHPAASPPAPDLPGAEGLRVVATSKKARLSWDAPGKSRIKRWAVYRGVGDRPWEIEYQRIGIARRTRYTDRSIPAEGIAFYYVAALDDEGREGGASLRVRTQPRAPREPRAAVVPGEGVLIEWDRAPEKDLAGYHVYRGLGRSGYWDRIPHDGYAGEFERITVEPVKKTRFLDSTEDPEHTAWLITAVNRRGIQSGPSPWSLGIPAEVQGVRTEETPEGVAIRWLENREAGILGYNIYRLDRPWDETACKLNEAPIREARYLDRTRTGRTPCKYYVAAVDARGVEGIVSFGAWAFDDGEQ